MKKIIKIIMICAITNNLLKAQTSPANCAPHNNTNNSNHCELGNGIKTNPTNLVNDVCPDLKNDFKWQVKHPIGSPAPNEYYITYDENGVVKGLRNPFNDPGISEYRSLSGNHSSNYHPEDGWELLKVDFGALSNINTGYSILDEPGINPNTGGKKLPYMILYNKYSGTFRFFGSILGQNQDYSTIKIELRIPKFSPNKIIIPSSANHYNPDLKATNLLSIQGGSIQPLDEETEENVLVVFATATNNESSFFWFDIPVAYDPCLCNFKSQLDISFTFVKTADIKLNEVEDAIKTEKKQDNSDFGLKVVTRVLAAGVATASAISTGGAVVNVQAYIDLVNLVKTNPKSNLSQAEKNQLTELENVLNCGNKFAKVVQKNFDDIDGIDNKKQAKAAIEIIDANTTLMTSLVTSGCGKTDNASNLVTDLLNMSGTWTETTTIQNTRISLAMPGSNWSDIKMQNNAYTYEDVNNINDPLNNTTIPAYPTYNERLGTFAMLETPVLQFHDSLGFDELDRTNPNRILFPRFVRFELKDDLKFSFNPKLNINLNKTVIYCRYIITDNLSMELIPINFTTFDNKNIIKSSNNFIKFTSPFVPLENFKDLSVIGLFNDNILETFNGKILIQFKIIIESNDIGKNNEPNKSYMMLSFPTKLSLQNIPQRIITKNNVINIQRELKDFNSNIIFSQTKDLAFDGEVYISAKMSTTNGAKVKIYSLKGFVLEPGAEISPDIELIVGLPLEKIPQPPQTYAQVSAFCNNNSKYKAQTFSQSAVKREKEAYEEQARAMKEYEEKQKSIIAFKLSPNPTTANFTVSIFNNNEQDYSIALMDVTGKVLFNNSYNGKQTSQFIETNGLAAGIYFVKITCGNTQKTEKLIIHSNQ
ncbi:MAG: T9SS type A sorting domain-containing protein [Bacteroidota bacterium]|nr:T9SS type A sorting domain-containing protein [Bacteroidota bacterium]